MKSDRLPQYARMAVIFMFAVTQVMGQTAQEPATPRESGSVRVLVAYDSLTVAPGTDIGFDLAAEYEEAKKSFDDAH